MKQVKITVLRKQLYSDLVRRYLTEPPEECVCDFFEEGDTFLYTGGAEMPAGFCPWAWIDIYRSVSALSCGATYTPWQKDEGATVVCCTDGIRPVTFLLEAVDPS
ncbi:TIGR04076 family protein [Flavonifractor sp. An52]|uniref:TIGR04076 family protein n=1 Tax=Flavonifractor sp. An52 TaxID=1965642 RepID=UPI000B3657F6|nr:TIGR04076 family protein [Flavonifractor sp. An52]OUN83551.1 TIGR04076 family protein [Flavonifractor sp. An52]